MTDQHFLEDSVFRVEKLQEIVFHMINNGVEGDPKEAMLEYFHTMYALLNAQGQLYTRLQLMSDDRYDGILSAITEVTDTLGRKGDQSVMEYHYLAKKLCLSKISEITGESVESLENHNIDNLDDFGL